MYKGTVRVSQLNIRESTDVGSKDLGDLHYGDVVDGTKLVINHGYQWLQLVDGSWIATGKENDPTAYVDLELIGDIPQVDELTVSISAKVDGKAVKPVSINENGDVVLG